MLKKGIPQSSFEVAEALSVFSLLRVQIEGLVVGFPEDVSDLVQDIQVMGECSAQSTTLFEKVSADVLVVSGLDNLSDSDLQKWDLRLKHQGDTTSRIFVVSENTVGRLEQFCPCWLSRVCGVFYIDSTTGKFSQEDRDSWLEELAQYFGMTNEQAVDLAERGDILPDPDFACWLSLLGRGDLLT